MENKVIFVEGLNVFTPNENAPDFVKASMVINKEKFITWLQTNGQYLSDGKYGTELRLQIKESKQGKLYASVDTYKPKTNSTVEEKLVALETEDDLPF